MDQKKWLWKRRVSEKTIVTNGKSELSLKGDGEELQIQSDEKELPLQESLDILNEKLTFILSECDAKDKIVADHAKKAEEALAAKDKIVVDHARKAEEALAAQEKAEAEVLRLKEELNEALLWRAAENERISNLNAALKDCMQQLNSAREEQEQRIQEAVITTSKELEKAHKKLEERLMTMNKRLTNLTAENSHLTKVLIDKDILIEDLSKCKTQAEEEFNTLMARLDSTEKENAFLRYEFRMLEKELDIRNEEVKFSQYSLDASHKQNFESVKKIKKLEAECQRLRVLLRKRLPGPAALARMSREVELQSGNQIETRLRHLNSVTGSVVVRDSLMETLPENPRTKVNVLMERLRDVEEENKILKDIVAQKDGEIYYSKLAVSKASEVESQLAELCKFQDKKFSSRNGYESGKEGKFLSSRSSASPSVSELEQLKHEDPKNASERKMLGISDMSLMDDFIEMEKLAIVAVDSNIGCYRSSSNVSDSLISSSTTDIGSDRASSCKEIVLVGQNEFNEKDQEHQTLDSSAKRPYDWLQHVLNIILEQNHLGRSLNDLLEDIRIALSQRTYLCSSEAWRGLSVKEAKPEQLPISGFITWRSPVTSPRVGLSTESQDGNLTEKVRKETVESSLSRSIHKIIELVTRFNPKFVEALECQQRSTSVDYIIHVFRWKRYEIAAVIQQFVDTCKSLLDGRVNFDKFAEEMASELGWITDRCVAHEEISSSKDELDKLSNMNGSRGQTQVGFRDISMIEMEKYKCILQVENKGLVAELNTAKSLHRELQAKLHAENENNVALTNELQQSQHSIGKLRAELETLKESRRMIEDHFENQKSINEDLDTQLSVAKAKLNEALHKLSSLEVELEDKSQCCEDLEGTCLELQLQLESITNKETPQDNNDEDEKMHRAVSFSYTKGWEINAASAKLDECQETILKLEKQLKALASPKETTAPNKPLTASTINTGNKFHRRLSLLDRMQFEDRTEETEDMESPTTTEIHTATVEVRSASPNEALSGKAGALAILPSKKPGGSISFLKKLLLRRKKRGSRKHSFAIAA